MTMLTNKDLAAEMGCTIETLTMRRQLLKILPTFCGYNGQRWSRADADKFILQWSTFTQKNVTQSSSTMGARTRNAVPQKAQGNRRDGQRAGNRASHPATARQRQFNLVIQYEIPVPIPTVPPPASESSAPIRYRGEWWYEEMKEWICEGSWPTVEEAEKEMTRRNKCFSWVPTRVRPVIYPLNGTAPIFPTEPANRASQPSQSYSANCDGSEIFLDFR